MWPDNGFTSFSNSFLIKSDTSVFNANEFKYALILAAKVIAGMCIYRGGSETTKLVYMYWTTLEK